MLSDFIFDTVLVPHRQTDAENLLKIYQGPTAVLLPEKMRSKRSKFSHTLFEILV